MSTTKLTRHIDAPRERVYAALIDPEQLVRWKVPDGMTMQVHEFDGREGGRYRISLTYDDPARAGKSAGHTDTYHGHFASLVPNERVVETVEFETDDPAMQGEMTTTITLADAPGGGTNLSAVHDGLPRGVKPEDNDTGWRMAIDKLAKLVQHA